MNLFDILIYWDILMYILIYILYILYIYICLFILFVYIFFIYIYIIYIYLLYYDIFWDFLIWDIETSWGTNLNLGLAGMLFLTEAASWKPRHSWRNCRQGQSGGLTAHNCSAALSFRPRGALCTTPQASCHWGLVYIKDVGLRSLQCLLSSCF